jgi:hypothetical protein
VLVCSRGEGSRDHGELGACELIIWSVGGRAAAAAATRVASVGRALPSVRGGGSRWGAGRDGSMAAPVHAEEIPRFIDSQIKPHLNRILRVLGNERPAAPIEFIADCFVNNSVPERSAPRSWEESLMSYLLSHDVVARVERAIATCAIRHGAHCLWPAKAPRAHGASSRVHGPTSPPPVVFVHAATVENPLEFIGNLLREEPEPEEAVPPRAAQTRPRPAALEVPGGGAGAASARLSPRADGAPPMSPKSPGSIATPASKSKMDPLSLQSPSPRGLDSARSSSYETISVR